LALAPLLDGRLKFTPQRYADTYRNWLENLRDWPISRQLWWGHRIPIWSYKLSEGATEATVAAFASLSQGEPPAGADILQPEDLKALQAAADIEGRFPDRVNRRFSSTPDPGAGRITVGMDYEFVAYVCLLDDSPELVRTLEAAGWQRDEDVLDTWFSSALWPFSTLGWPEDKPEVKTYYPGDVLCTAREIITLWVSRMVMMGQYCLGDIPFADVFIHAMIQDGEGRKMSKSLGNGIDPLVVIDSHGADAMRFTVVSMTTQTQDVRMPLKEIELPDGRKVNSSEKFDIGRNFCNKLWNASRFAMMNIAGAPPWQTIHPKGNLADAWILSRLNATIRDVTAAVERFRFNELADMLYHFMWDDLCDWYLEIAKVRINAGQDTPKAVLAHCLDVFLRLLHPIAPFITEAIWQHLNAVVPLRGPTGEPAEPMLVTAQWPYADAAAISPACEEQFALLQDLIRQVRNVRTQHGVPPKRLVGAAVEARGAAAALISENLDLLESQAGMAGITVSDEIAAPPAGSAAITAGGAKLYVLDIIDVEAERVRLGKQAEMLRKGIGGIEGKLANENFVSKAPAQVVQQERERLARLQDELTAVENALEAIS
jgi:valyl-tRNA synthetase